MRTSSARLTKNTRVCGDHFVGGQRSKEHPIPTEFPWSVQDTRPSRPPPKDRRTVPMESDSDSVSDNHEDNVEDDQDSCDVPDSSNKDDILEVRSELEMLLENNLDLQQQLADSRAEIERLRAEIDKLKESEAEARASSIFSVEKIKDNDTLTRFYTGIPGYRQFETLLQFLSEPCDGMSMWNGKRTVDQPYVRQPVRALSHANSILLTLMKLKLDCPNEDLAQRFAIGPATVSRVFTTYLMLMYRVFKSAQLPAWPSRQQVDAIMPQRFADLYPKTRCIIDCTEFPVHVPSNPDSQRVTWSAYKNRNTFKALVCITPTGAISFVSDLFGSSVSDRELTKSCGILDLLEKDDTVMADKGFTISDLCEERGATLNVPPFIKSNQQLTEQELVQTRRIASLRVHVERAIERIKNFHILDMIHSLHFDVSSEIFLVCCILADFHPPLIS